MGNNNSKFKLDIISNLPPELVLEIICYLSVAEVARCTLVSKSWNHIISQSAPFWTNAASRIVGLSKNAISMSMMSFVSPKEFFISAVNHKARAKTLNLTPNHIRHPVPEDLLFTQCLEARQQFIVRTQKMDRNNLRQDLVVEQLAGIQQIPDGIFSQAVALLPLDKQSKVTWAHMSDRFLYWVTTSGIWSCYDLISKCTIYTWRNQLLEDGKGVKMGKCKDCSMVVLSHWSPSPINLQEHRSTHAIQIVRLGDRSSMPEELVHCKLVQKKHSHLFFAEQDSRYWLRSAFVLSNSEEKESGVCLSHQLILQCDCCTMVHSLHTSIHKEKDIDVNVGKPACLNCDYQISPNGDFNSEVALSSDDKLLAQVLDKQLYVWHNNRGTHIQNSSMKMISNSPLVRKNSSTCNSVKLVAVGHVLSTIAYMDNSYLLDYSLHVVLTNTGEVLSEFRRIERFYNWSLCCQIDPLHKFYFMHEDDHWLNDVRAKIPATPVTTLHNHHGRIHMEALQLKTTGMQSWRKYWRCAINYGLRE